MVRGAKFAAVVVAAVALLTATAFIAWAIWDTGSDYRDLPNITAWLSRHRGETRLEYYAMLHRELHSSEVKQGGGARPIWCKTKETGATDPCEDWPSAPDPCESVFQAPGFFLGSSIPGRDLTVFFDKRDRVNHWRVKDTSIAGW